MVWSALLAGGLSLLSGFGAQKSAKKQAKTQAANDLVANTHNRFQIDEANKINKDLGKRLGRELANTKEVTVEETKGGGSTTTQNSSTVGSVDYERMMKDAEAAGFNPVTFLNAGGLQAYSRQDFNASTRYDQDPTTVTTTRTGHNAVAVANLKATLMSPQIHQMNATQAQRIPDTMEVIGNAGQAGLNVYREDQARQQSQDFQRELLGLQLDALKTRALGNKFGVVPTMTTSGGTSVTGVPGLSSKLNPITQGDREFTSPFSIRQVDPTVPNAEQAETRYGDVGQEIFGISNAIDDLMYNVTGLTKPQRYERYGKPVLDFLKNLGVNYKSDPAPSPLFLKVTPKGP